MFKQQQAWHIVIGFIFLGLISLSLEAWAISSYKDNRSPYRLGSAQNIIRAGLVIGEPFVDIHENKPTGMVVKLFEEIAEHYKWKYRYIPLGNNVSDAIMALRQNKVDILIGPVSVYHNRIMFVDFSRAFYINKIALAIPKPPQSVADIVLKLIKKISVILLFTFVLVLFFIATVIWALEHNCPNSELPSNPFKGIALSAWYLLVQFLRGGYSFSVRHKAPAARILLVLWLFFSLIIMLVFSSLLTAFLTTDMLKKYPQIKSKSELHGKTLGYINGAGSLKYIQQAEATAKGYNNILGALDELAKPNSKIDGVVDDYLILKQHLHFKKYKHLFLSHFIFAHDEFAFALPYHSPLLKPINIEIVRMQDNQDMFHLCQRYLKNEAAACEL